MLVTISDKSWSSKYYKWVTGVNASKRFKSLCPYFWTLFVYIVFSPFILTIKGIGYFFENLLIKPMVKKLEKDFDNSNFRSKKQSKVSEWWDDKGDTVLEYFGKTMMVFFILFVVFILVLSFIDTVRKSGLFMTLVYTFAIIGVIGIYLTGKKKWHGFAIGLIAEIAWVWCMAVHSVEMHQFQATFPQNMSWMH